MNPLTLVKRIQSINSKEAELGISEDASWHAKYKDSAYVFVGGIPFDLTEGDLLAVFAQYGEIVDVNLVRDQATGKSKGFAFIAYEDQRSTNLAVDNLNGANVAGRIIRVDHVSKYKKKEEEDEETARQKREARGVCRAFQRGECARGASCKFSHDEQRAANTGGGPQDKGPRWGHDNFEGAKKNDTKSATEGPSESHFNSGDKREDKRAGRYDSKQFEPNSREDYRARDDNRLRRHEGDELDRKTKEDSHRADEKRLRRYGDDKYEQKSREDYQRHGESRHRRHGDNQYESKSREDDYRRDERRSRKHGSDELDRREEKRSRRHESGSHHREGDDKKARENWSSRGGDSSSCHRERDDHRHKSDR